MSGACFHRIGIGRGQGLRARVAGVMAVWLAVAVAVLLLARRDEPAAVPPTTTGTLPRARISSHAAAAAAT